MRQLFKDRYQAGRRLAEAFRGWRGNGKPLVLGLPRGGVPVAWEIAHALGAELDMLLVRKLGLPGQPELAMGAIGEGDVRVLDQELIDSAGVTESQLEAVIKRESRELKRREAYYRNGRPSADIRGRTVIVVDDGLATGATMRAAIRMLRRGGPASIIVAVPVASARALREVSREADEVVCLNAPRDFQAVGQWYLHFDQTEDEEVRRLLRQPAEAELFQFNAPAYHHV